MTNYNELISELTERSSGWIAPEDIPKIQQEFEKLQQENHELKSALHLAEGKLYRASINSDFISECFNKINERKVSDD